MNLLLKLKNKLIKQIGKNKLSKRIIKKTKSSEQIKNIMETVIKQYNKNSVEYLLNEIIFFDKRKKKNITLTT